MRHLRYPLIIALAALVAGCFDSDQPNPASPDGTPNRPTTRTCSSIGDRVWLDKDCEGDQDKNETGYTEPGVEGVVVNLYLCDGTFVTTTTTDVNGLYLFEVPDAPASYKVCFELPPGYSFTPAGVGSEGSDSDAGADGCTSCFPGGECLVIRDVDAGLCVGGCTSTIGDRVYLDKDCDGFQDGDEHGVAGVVVNLYTCAGQFVATTTTDGNGLYNFDVPEAVADYKVCFQLPPGYHFAPADLGNEDTDSDAGADGCTGCFTGGGCASITDIDAGLCVDEGCASTIGDRVWLDVDCDGDQDKNDSGYTEPGVAGVVVNLYTCAGEFVATTTTDGNGLYNFDVPETPADYKVCFELPPGFTFAPPNVGGDSGDSDAGADGCTNCFTGGGCELITNVDAGLCQKPEGEYCSPGFWKNHYSHWGPTGYSPSDVFDDVFDCDLFGDDTTLGDAIHIEHTHNVLAFHATAALLDASHPSIDFPLSPADVQAAVCAGDLDALTGFTENCPLSGGNNHSEDH